MKHHIAVKFIAVLLATLSLFTLLASSGCIIFLTASDLYEQSVEDKYEDNMTTTRQNLAVRLVHQYASLSLGKLPEAFFYDYSGTSWMYDNFQYGYYFYTICDENGKMVESTADDLPPGTTAYTHVVTELSFRHLIRILPSETTGSETEPNVTLPPDTDIVVIPDALPAAAALIPEEEILLGSYFDPEQGNWVDFTYFLDKLPPYTVTLYLLPGAVTVEPIWDILSVIWQLRYVLFYILGISVLIFAICMVYLCCAAAKKPGQTELKAAGLNCIPLDLYAAAGGFLIFFALLVGIEVAEYLVRNTPQMLVPFVTVAGCGMCLVAVGFCFACAAQFKTPGGYWWRNTLVGHILRACRLIIGNAFVLCKRSVPWIKNAVIFLWQKIGLLIFGIYRLVRKILSHIFRLIGKAMRWIWKMLSRFLGMLPLTWQWLITGFGMFLLMAVVFASNGEEVLTVICLSICIGIILYGAHAFGILMENVKRMSKGDLETKVSDQFLIGIFREFAGELNDLADVAAIAAQKQLKSERMKTELITNVSHDIKTPLTSIINYVDLLEKPHTEEEGAAYLEVLHRQSQRLKKLVDDLMEMSKASTGNLPVDIVSVNAEEAINQSLGEFADKLERSQLTAVFRQPEAPIYMKADGRLVWRVMSNILSNAVKYALPGTRLYIDLTELDGKVFISMKNISREELNVNADELLERFVRGDVSRNTEGSGLGLNIAKSLMELQKGQLQLLVDGDLFKVTLIFPSVQM